MWLPGEHVSFGRLVDLAEGSVSLTSEDQAHLVSCERCSHDLAWLEHLIALTRDAVSEDPPAAVVTRCKALFRERRRPAPTAPRLLPALLCFDSAHGAQVIGLRAERALDRQIFLSADGYDVTLWAVPADSRWAITGQILPTAPTPILSGSAELLGAYDQARAELSELSEFALPPVRAGRYIFTISLGDLVIAFPDLDLGV